MRLSLAPLTAFAIALAFAVSFAFAAPAAFAASSAEAGLAASTVLQETSDVGHSWSIQFSGVSYGGDFGIYGTPGEKLSMKASLMDWNTGKKAKGATFKLTAPKSLKASIKGGKLVVKKLPKAGTYKVKAKAYTKSGDFACKTTVKVVVKKKPNVKVSLRKQTKKGGFEPAKSVKADANMMLDIKGASWGWDNNTKKHFCSLKVKYVDTGEIATWKNKTGSFEDNDFIECSSVAGGINPVLMGKFMKPGTYKVKVVVYHSNKKIASNTATFVVK